MDEKPLVCGICKKGSLTKINLNIHPQINIDVKADVCKICNKTFSTNSNLNNHFRRHTDEMPLWSLKYMLSNNSNWI